MARVNSNVKGGTGKLGTAGVIYTDGVNADMASLDTMVKYNGHATMKYNQPGGISQTPEMWAALPKTSKHIWIRTHIRFSPGYTTTGSLTNSASAYKMLGWGWASPNGSGRIEISNTNQYQNYWNVQNGGTLIGGGNFTFPGNITTEWTDGAWYTYIIEVDHSTSTGVSRLYMARGTATPTLKSSTPGKMFDGSALPALNYVFLGLNFNQVRLPNQNQAVWYGDWEVVDGTQYADPFGVN
jgi:hypothetical protein